MVRRPMTSARCPLSAPDTRSYRRSSRGGFAAADAGRSLDLVAAARRTLSLLVVVLAVWSRPPRLRPPTASRGVSSSNWVTKVLSLEPALAGVTVKSVQLGNLIQITSRNSELIVLGYLGEPYLRVGPGGVYQNLRSPATYLNRTRLGTTPLPPLASTTRPRRPSGIRSPAATRRYSMIIAPTGWAASSPPPIRADPHRTFELSPDWHIQLRQGDTAGHRHRLADLDARPEPPALHRSRRPGWPCSPR